MEPVNSGADFHIEWKPSRKQWFIIASLSFISFVVSLDATILVTVLPEISHSLQGSTAETFWTGTSYLLTSAVFQPVVAGATTCFDYRMLLVFSILAFALGTAFCAAADRFSIMLTGRCVQGVGGGGIIAMTQVIFARMIPLRQQPKYFSMVLVSWSIGSIIGPVLGGTLVEASSWRWCFHINFPFCGIGLLAALLFHNDGATSSLAHGLRKMDWIGAVLFVSSLTSFLVGISWGGTQFAWLSAATLVPIILGILGIFAFAKWQIQKQPQSLLPTSLFYNGSSIAAYYCALVNGIILFTALYYVPFYQMSVLGSSPVRAGVDLLPAVCLLVPSAVVVSIVASRIGRFRWAIYLGWLITVVSCGLFNLFDKRTEKGVFSLTLAMFGVGNGMVLTGNNIATQAIARTEDRAIAASMYGFMRSVGMPVGIALSGSLFQNVMGRALSDAGLSADIARDSERFVAVLRNLADTDPSKAAILHTYIKGFHSVFTAMTAISASALVVSLFIRKFSMDSA